MVICISVCILVINEILSQIQFNYAIIVYNASSRLLLMNNILDILIH